MSSSYLFQSAKVRNIFLIGNFSEIYFLPRLNCFTAVFGYSRNARRHPPVSVEMAGKI